ncbi:MAG: phosphoribosylglycinamide formyltransferase 2 [Oceanicoccus sp.]|jgi:phosphoribosylglycinamide formyltransferase 2
MDFPAPLKSNSIKIMLLGSGELGKEVVIEAQRLGVETIAVDRYPDAPAHSVANRSYVVDMKDKAAVMDLIRKEKPDYILPEIEALSIEALFELEAEGFHVIPNAEAVNKSMNRKNIRKYASEDLGLLTSKYRFVKNQEELGAAADELGYPCVIKPVMSSSGHGQSVARSPEDIERSWQISQEARGDASELIVEEFIEFDYEITLMTARTEHETVFCDPIGHTQQDGDYIFSWQPMEMAEAVQKKAEAMAKKVTDGLGGRGIFGVEFFVKGEDVYFSELSPRPHDTGMVTMMTQSQSEFALHVRAVLGLPLAFHTYGPGASAAYKASSESEEPVLTIPEECFAEDAVVRVFGKPDSHKGRRMAVILTYGENALERGKELIAKITDR